MMNGAWRLVLVLACFGPAGCKPFDPTQPGASDDAAVPRFDGSTATDMRIVDGAPLTCTNDGAAGTRLPDGGCLVSDPNGPQVRFVAPAADTVVITASVAAQVEVRPNGRPIDYVELSVPGTDRRTRLTLSTTPNVYTGSLNLSQLASGGLLLVATAVDLLSRVGTAQLTLVHDAGPSINVFKPQAGARYRGQTALEFTVSNPSGDSRFDVDVSKTYAAVEQTRIPLTLVADQDPPLWSGIIDFHAAAFGQGLSGLEQVRIVAQSKLGAVAQTTVNFIVDETGPDIVFEAPRAGSIVGGILQVTVNLSDPAGIDENQVVAQFAGDSRYRFSLRAVGTTATGASQFQGQFDTRQLPDALVLPIISVRAVDTVGNSSERSESLIIDNVAPAIDLDPLDQVFALRVADNVCSHPFDPVGPDATNDGDITPQLQWLRARIEDRGNIATGQAVEFTSLVPQSNASLYVIRGTDAPLIVDTDGDGICDEINPELVPVATITANKQALVVPLAPIPVSGQPDFSIGNTTGLFLPLSCNGSIGAPSDTAPKQLCPVASPVIFDLGYTSTGREPAIWSIPPIQTGTLLCQGLQFDAANSIPDGPVCAAVRAVDAAGNRNVSRPLRLCLDKNLSGVVCNTALYQAHGSPPAAGHANLPNCTGSIVSGVADGTKPCVPGVKRNTGRLDPAFPSDPQKPELIFIR